MAMTNARYKKSASIVSMEIDTGFILVPIRQSAGDLEDVYTLNETASRIWALVDGQRSVDQIREAIVKEFEVEDGQARQDVSELLAQLEAAGAVEQA